MKIRMRAIALTLAVLLLCGCGAKDKNQTQDPAELPEDQPYNHDGFTIMETDKGYYTDSLAGLGDQIALRFYEKDSENQIFLCAKPECQHNGSDSCTATYKGLTCLSSVLYNGAIYCLTLEKGSTVTYSLYKAALDGTSFTKVGDVYSVSNSTGTEEMDHQQFLIIHKGQAYISYRLALGRGTTGFVGSGLVKMDISNGASELLWSGEKYFSGIPQDLAGSGNYVYWSNLANNDEEGFFRYDINTGEIKRLWDKKYPLVGKNKFFFIEWDDEEGNKICSCGKEDADIDKAAAGELDFVTEMLDPHQVIYGSVIPFEDKLIMYDFERIVVFSEDGEKLGEIPFLDRKLDELDEWDQSFAHFGMAVTVSEGKLYISDHSCVINPTLREKYYAAIYSCPIEDVIHGTGKWKFEYGELDIFTSGMKIDLFD